MEILHAYIQQEIKNFVRTAINSKIKSELIDNMVFVYRDNQYFAEYKNISLKIGGKAND